mgnify:CR=1 FL=1
MGYYENYPVELDLRNGFLIGATLGRKINDAVRVEGELSYSRYKARSSTYNNRPASEATGKLSATYLLGNIWVDLARIGQARVYAGGGLGGAYVTGRTSFPEGGYGKGKTRAAGQLGAGVTFPIAKNFEVDFGYRLKGVTKVDFKDTQGGEPFTGGKLITHNLQFGLTAKF